MLTIKDRIPRNEHLHRTKNRTKWPHSHCLREHEGAVAYLSRTDMQCIGKLTQQNVLCKELGYVFAEIHKTFINTMIMSSGRLKPTTLVSRTTSLIYAQ